MNNSKHRALRGSSATAHKVRRNFSFILILAILFGNFSVPIQMFAASYTISWDTQGDFQNNTAGGISTTTISSLADTTTTAGSVIMGPGAASSVTETFSGTNGTNFHLDTANSVATTSTGVLRRSLVDTVSSLTSLISPYLTVNNPITSIVYNGTDNTLYLLGGQGGWGLPNKPAFLLRVNLSNSTATNLTSTVSGLTGWSTNGENAGLAWDSTNNIIFLGIGNIGQVGRLAYYNPSTNTAALATTSGSTPVFNPSDGKIYYTNGSSIFTYTYGVGNATFIATTSTRSISVIGYNPVDQTIMSSKGWGCCGGGYYEQFTSAGVFTRPYSSNTVMTSLAYDEADGFLFFLGENVTLVKKNGATFTTINNSLGMGSYTQYVIENQFPIAFNPLSNSVYGVTNSGATDSKPHVYRYGPVASSTPTFIDLSGYINNALGTSTIETTAMAVDSGGNIYMTNAAGMLASTSPPALTQYAQSTTLATVANGIPYATLTKTDAVGSGSISYYLSNDAGATWEGPVTPGSQWTFTNPTGTQLKYRVAITDAARMAPVATIASITISYNGYSTSTLKNLKKDAGGDSSWISIVWSATVPANTQLKFRTRGTTEAQGLAALFAASWSDYYTATTTGASGKSIQANGAGGALAPTYRYMEIEATLISDNGTSYPTLDSVNLTYALNTEPNFNTDYPTASAGGASASQVTASSSANWGKVAIDYSVRDVDTDSGTVSPGFISPSFEYRLNSGDTWHTISSDYLSTDATAQKAVAISDYTTYTAYWDAKSQIPSQYSATAQIRITANDNEAIHALGYATTSAMTLDTTAPSITTKRIDGSSSTSTISIIATDNTGVLDYRLSNDSDLSADGSNDSSGTLQATSTTSFGLASTWTLTGSGTSTVHMVLRDIYGNTSTTSAISPATPSNFELHDITNASAGLYKLFLTWVPFTSESGATFSSYRVFRSTDGSTYSLYQTITDSALNYYQDSSLASSTTYYYKVRTVDSDGDSSPFTEAADATPNGSGTTNLPPVVSSVAIDNVKNTSARVTWTTNALSNSVVSYGTTNAYGSSASSASYVLSHSVYLTGLQPNTTYSLKVTSTDIGSNAANDDNGGAGYTFTTVGGPVITGVTVNSIGDNTATVFWNTQSSADSYVYYSTNSNLSSPTTAGSATLVATTSTSGTYSHSVALTGLSASTNYYFYVASTDSSANTTVANNSGSYYSFLTTRDTTPPVISNITEPVVTPTAVVIVWQTDKPATTQVEYGATASTSESGYTSASTLDSTPSAYHVVTITGLSNETTYYYRVKSADSAGNMGVSSEQTFTTTDVEVITLVSGGGGGGSSSDRNTTPPTINSVTADPVNAFDASIKVTASTEVRAIIKYGEISSSTPTAPYTYSAANAELTRNKEIKLTSLRPGTSYHYIVTVIDKDGNFTQHTEQMFTTKYLSENFGDLSILTRAADLQGKLEDILESALPSLSPPAMSTPTVTDITEDSAKISWGTNIKSYTVLNYTNDESYQKDRTYEKELTDIQTASTTHQILLTGLQPNTKYHYSARAFVFPQVVARGPDYTFTTKAGPIRAQTIDVKPDSFRVFWMTEKPSSSAIDFTDRSTGTTRTISNKALSKQHDVVAENLLPGHTYEVRAYGYDAGGNIVSTETPLLVTTSVDRTAPQIIALRIQSTLVPGRADIVQSIISWKTDKLSTSTVYYQEGVGPVDGKLKNKIENDTGYVKDHVVLIPNLKPSSIYRIQVSSTDQAGNTLLLPVRTVVTPQQSESIVDIIFKNFSDTFDFIR